MRVYFYVISFIWNCNLVYYGNSERFLSSGRFSWKWRGGKLKRRNWRWWGQRVRQRTQVKWRELSLLDILNGKTDEKFNVNSWIYSLRLRISKFVILTYKNTIMISFFCILLIALASWAQNQEWIDGIAKG